MSELSMIRMHKTVPGSAKWLERALDRVTESCSDDPHAETDGRELGEHLVESFCHEPEIARYCFIIAVNETEVHGHIIARIDVGYENRRQCWIGFFALDQGFHWTDIIEEGFGEIEEWAKGHGCLEILISAYSQSHARLYRLPRYGGFDTRNLVLSRRID